MTSTALQPVAVYHVDNTWFSWRHWREAEAWCFANGLASVDPHSYTYRVEVYLMDTPYAVVFRYAVNEHGRSYVDLLTDTVALAEPVTVMLAELPPPHLRR